MNKKIIELMILFGYEYLEEQPSQRLLFYDTDMEQTIQIWKHKTTKDTMIFAANLIKSRLVSNAKSIGRYEVQNEIKKSLGL